MVVVVVILQPKIVLNSNVIQNVQMVGQDVVQLVVNQQKVATAIIWVIINVQPSAQMEEIHALLVLDVVEMGLFAITTVFPHLV